MKKEQLLDLYHQMVLIRRVEERGAELYQAGKIGGFMHLYIGQEAVSTGLIAAREPRDRVITAYRDHGVAINCGIPATEVMAELLGKATGMSKGKGGSMHMASVEKNMWGGHAIVGGHLPIAAGLALGDHYAKNDNVTICMFGDGATNIGYDAQAIWNLRARFMYRSGNAWEAAFSPLINRNFHMDYPLLVPLSVLGGWTTLGGEVLRVPSMLSMLFLYSCFRYESAS